MILKKYLLLIPALIILFFIYGGGYWENLPILNRLSGPMRFRQLVTNPVPSYIQNIYGGYSGFPSGMIKTHFSFTSPPETWQFLKDWGVVKPECLKEILVWVPEFVPSSVYHRSSSETAHSCSDGTYLLVDSNNVKGIILLP